MPTVTMDSDRLAKFGRYFLIVVNLIFVFLGSFAFGGGAIYIMRTASATSSSHLVHVIALMVGGILTVIVSSVGYLGARRENAKLLKIYAWIFIVLLIFKVIFVIVNIMGSKGHVGLPDMSKVKTVFDNYGSHSAYTKAVDIIQTKLHCCGYTGPESMKMDNGTYPSSCCLLDEQDCYVPYEVGCESQIPQYSAQAIMAIQVAFYVLPVVKIFCIMAALYLAASIEWQMDFKFTNF